MRVFWTVLIVLVLLSAGIVVFAYSGLYDIAATRPHTMLIRELVDTTMVHSVRAHAQNIQVPDLSQPSVVEEGAAIYAEMCVSCHGGPGVDRSPVGKGLYPSPPNLAEGPPVWSPAELFWILEHGIKMTGMPAFGPTHSENKLWSVVAFLDRLHELSPEEYRQLTQEEKHGSSDEAHLH